MSYLYYLWSGFGGPQASLLDTVEVTSIFLQQPILRSKPPRYMLSLVHYLLKCPPENINRRRIKSYFLGFINYTHHIPWTTSGEREWKQRKRKLLNEGRRGHCSNSKMRLGSISTEASGYCWGHYLWLQVHLHALRWWLPLGLHKRMTVFFHNRSKDLSRGAFAPGKIYHSIIFHHKIKDNTKIKSRCQPFQYWLAVTDLWLIDLIG